jgi:hypothetical protein
VSPVRTFTVMRGWRYPGYTGGVEDGLILVDGVEIGGTYWCGAQDIPDDRRWASYGPAGTLYGDDGFATRDTAEAAQVRAYVTDPEECDRLIAQREAARAAEFTARQAQEKAKHRAWLAADHERRCGTDEPGPTLWAAPAYHGLYAPLAEVDAVSAWLAAHGIADQVSGAHEIRVEQRATRRVIVFEAPTALAALAAAMGQPTRDGCERCTETWVVALVCEPPAITVAPRPDLAPVFAIHWPSRFPLIDYGADVACGHCTRQAGATRPHEMVAWPCPAVVAGAA